MPDPDALNRLAAAGFAVHALRRDEQRVLAELTTAELELLVDIKARLDDVGPEVVAHGEIAGGALF